MPPTKTKPRKPTSKKPITTAEPARGSGAAISEFTVGDEIAHPLFGDGKVTEVEGDKLTIEFADGRIKHIVDYYVRRKK
jgi:DNA helicase-2/ATP-dependent DNA helicase PcrA